MALLLNSMETIETDAQAWRALHDYVCDMVMHGDIHAKRALNALCGLSNIPLLEPSLTLDTPGADTQQLANVLFRHFACLCGTQENATTVARYMCHRRNHNDMHAQETLKFIAQVLGE